MAKAAVNFFAAPIILEKQVTTRVRADGGATHDSGT
jgi:hypothetical protein